MISFRLLSLFSSSFLCVLLVPVVLVVVVVTAQEVQQDCTAVTGEPSCFAGEFCSGGNPPGCSVFGCSMDTAECVDVMDNVVACKPVDNACGSIFCPDGCFCGGTSGTCQVQNCENWQKEECPASLSFGTCDPSGSTCPTSVASCTYSVTGSTTTFTSSCVNGGVGPAGGDATPPAPAPAPTADSGAEPPTLAAGPPRVGFQSFTLVLTVFLVETFGMMLG